MHYWRLLCLEGGAVLGFLALVSAPSSLNLKRSNVVNLQMPVTQDQTPKEKVLARTPPALDEGGTEVLVRRINSLPCHPAGIVRKR